MTTLFFYLKVNTCTYQQTVRQEHQACFVHSAFRKQPLLAVKVLSSNRAKIFRIAPTIVPHESERQNPAVA